jgi:hypothetical protein
MVYTGPMKHYLVTCLKVFMQKAGSTRPFVPYQLYPFMRSLADPSAQACLGSRRRVCKTILCGELGNSNYNAFLLRINSEWKILKTNQPSPRHSLKLFSYNNTCDTFYTLLIHHGIPFRIYGTFSLVVLEE